MTKSELEKELRLSKVLIRRKGEVIWAVGHANRWKECEKDWLRVLASPHAEVVTMSQYAAGWIPAKGSHFPVNYSKGHCAPVSWPKWKKEEFRKAGILNNDWVFQVDARLTWIQWHPGIRAEFDKVRINLAEPPSTTLWARFGSDRISLVLSFGHWRRQEVFTFNYEQVDEALDFAKKVRKEVKPLVGLTKTYIEKMEKIVARLVP